MYTNQKSKYDKFISVASCKMVKQPKLGFLFKKKKGVIDAVIFAISRPFITFNVG